MKKKGMTKLLIGLVSLMVVVLILIIILFFIPVKDNSEDNSLTLNPELELPTVEVLSFTENSADIDAVIKSGEGNGIIHDVVFLIEAKNKNCSIEQNVDLSPEETIGVNMVKDGCQEVISIDVEILSGGEQ